MCEACGCGCDAVSIASHADVGLSRKPLKYESLNSDSYLLHRKITKFCDYTRLAFCGVPREHRFLLILTGVCWAIIYT